MNGSSGIPTHPRPPLPTLLSYAIVAFTIEFDNEAEHRLPHTTTRHGKSVGARGLHAPWLVSLVMYLNCMLFLDREGIPLGTLEQLARTSTNLPGMQRWGYVYVTPGSSGLKSISARQKKPGPDSLIRATAAGERARAVWAPLLLEIEQRWSHRFGKSTIAELREALLRVVVQLDPLLPDCLPILGYGLCSQTLPLNQKRPAAQPVVAEAPLISLLQKVLLAFALEFEHHSEVSLAICANVLRLLGPEGPATPAELVVRSGASKEAIAVAASFLTRHGFATLGGTADSRKKALYLTEKGHHAYRQYLLLLPRIEQEWRSRFSDSSIDGLASCLSSLIAESPDQLLPLSQGLKPYPDGWRAALAKPRTLPHYPLILHRGGFPDGS